MILVPTIHLYTLFFKAPDGANYSVELHTDPETQEGQLFVNDESSGEPLGDLYIPDASEFIDEEVQYVEEILQTRIGSGPKTHKGSTSLIKTEEQLFDFYKKSKISYLDAVNFSPG